ncbi:MAG TPA: RibD family protein [Candidatus Methanoperedenaceae archaeon]|nr:RibD family protein [Candidatus Methanoperedenaceae archaeon]
MLPRVILHNEVSVDGRMDWISPDIGIFYELASRWKEDATLAGCDTILKQEKEMPEEDDEVFEPQKKKSGDKRPLLVIPDSRGRVRKWHALRKAGYWRDVMALCSHSTPMTYLDYLRKRHIDHVIAGTDHVDLKAALEVLNARYGVGLVRVDSGGTLNGVLLRAGLVDEVSVLFNPSLVGGMSTGSFFRAPDLMSKEKVINLELIHVEKVKGDRVWLRYKVVRWNTTL